MPDALVFFGPLFMRGKNPGMAADRGRFFGLTQAIAFICEYASTRIGIPEGEYFYSGSTDHELYLSSIPFMDFLSFSSLLFGGDSWALIGVNTWGKGWANKDGYWFRD